jgi:FkbM family methyltransferase
MPSVRRIKDRIAARFGSASQRAEAASLAAWKALRDIRARDFDDAYGGAFLSACRRYLSESQSQLFQDAFVLSELGEKTDGFFVEFGATDGVLLSNTHLLETRFGWRGVLAEPARIWCDRLAANRACAIDLRCVAAASGGEITFNETTSPELSTIDRFSSGDQHADKRSAGARYQVQTVSLNDLLKEHGAPHDIDYLSVDTEGSELEILSAFDFDAFRPRIVTVEHNHVEQTRVGLHALLTAKGYTRKLEAFSAFDDWYVLA